MDSDYAWGEFTTALGWTDAAEFTRRNDAFYAQYKAGTLDIHDYVRFATAAIRRARRYQIQQLLTHEFMRAVVQKAIQPQALELVRQHQAAGDAVVIVTATNEFVTRPDCRGLWRARADCRRPGTRPGQRLVHRRNRRHAVVPRRQGHAGGAVAGRARLELGAMSKAPSTATPSTTCRCWKK